MPEWQVDALLELQELYAAGKGGDVSGVRPQLLERTPIQVDEFPKEFREELHGQVASA